MTPARAHSPREHRSFGRLASVVLVTGFLAVGLAACNDETQQGELTPPAGGIDGNPAQTAAEPAATPQDRADISNGTPTNPVQ